MFLRYLLIRLCRRLRPFITSRLRINNNNNIPRPVSQQRLVLNLFTFPPLIFPSFPMSPPPPPLPPVPPIILTLTQWFILLLLLFFPFHRFPRRSRQPLPRRLTSRPSFLTTPFGPNHNRSRHSCRLKKPTSRRRSTHLLTPTPSLRRRPTSTIPPPLIPLLHTPVPRERKRSPRARICPTLIHTITISIRRNENREVSWSHRVTIGTW